MSYLLALFDNSVSYVFPNLTLVFGVRALINARISNADFKADRHFPIRRLTCEVSIFYFLFLGRILTSVK